MKYADLLILNTLPACELRESENRRANFTVVRFHTHTHTHTLCFRSGRASCSGRQNKTTWSVCLPTGCALCCAFGWLILVQSARLPRLHESTPKVTRIGDAVVRLKQVQKRKQQQQKQQQRSSCKINFRQRRTTTER